MSYDANISDYQLGRYYAAEQDGKLEHFDTPEAEAYYLREQEIVAEAEKRGGWSDEMARGYQEAKREYAAERS